jgi:hypothetical protein
VRMSKAGETNYLARGCSAGVRGGATIVRIYRRLVQVVDHDCYMIRRRIAAIRRWRLVVLLLAATIALTACGDYFYYVVFENHTNKPLVASMLSMEYRLRPCSVKKYVTGGTRFGKPVAVVVRDESGQLVHTTEFRSGPNGEGGPFLVRVPASAPATCPTPAPRYSIKVENEDRDEVQLWLDGSLMATVPPLSSGVYGPFLGTWQDAARMVTQFPDGERENVSTANMYIDYDLGQEPVLGVSISSR